MSQVAIERRRLLTDVRSHIRCHVYKHYIIGLQWNPGKSEQDKQFGNVTAYVTEPDGTNYLLPLRMRLSIKYQEEIAALTENIKSYIDKTEAVAKACKAWREHRWIQ